MIEEKYLELIQADVDGELPEQHRAELGRYLLANPEARAAREELKRLCGLLDSIPAVEPPADLKASVLGAVRLPPARSGSSNLPGFGVPSRMLRYAAVFAGGLLVSAIAFQVGLDRRSGLDISQVAGTMASQDPAATSAPVDTVKVSLEQVSGQVSLYRSPSMRVVEFDLRAHQPVEVVVAHDGQEAKFSSIGAAGTDGKQRYALVLDGAGRPGEPIEVRFLAAGAVIHRDSLGGQGAH
jgi:hypothetical protein